MAQVSAVQRSFEGGLWSQSLSGRSDHASYGSALSVCRNFIPRLGGSAAKRPGTAFIASTKDPTAECRLLRMVFDQENAYIIELGHLYARFYKNDAQIESSPGVAYEVATPWTEMDLFEIQYAHDADTLVLTHRDYQPRLLQRTSDAAWTLSALTFTYGPYLNRNEVMPSTLAFKTGSTVFAAKLTVGGADENFRTNPGSRTVTADGSVFDATRDIGRILIVGDGELSTNDDESFAVGRISAVASATSATVAFFDGSMSTEEVVDTGPQEPTLNWWMQAYFGGTVISRWPSACTFSQQRLWLGGGETGGDLLYGSRTGSITDFDLWSYADVDPPTDTDDPNIEQHTILDTSGINIELSYPEVHQLRWIRGSRNRIVCGTSRAVFVLTPGQDGFTPLATIDASPTSAQGSHTLSALAIQERIHFISGSQIAMTRVGFSLEADAFVAGNLSLFSPDVLQPGVVDFDIVYSPEPILWCVVSDGRLAGLTIDESQRVVAWHDHTLGGNGIDADYGEVRSVAVIPSTDGAYDQLWMVVRRMIGGVTARFVERLDQDHRPVHGNTDQRFLDARGEVYSGVAATTFSGFDHLEGEEVGVLADGAASPAVQVTSGDVTIDDAATHLVAGLPYTGEVTTMPIVIPLPNGQSLGNHHRLSHAEIRVVRSIGGDIGGGDPHEDQAVYPIEYRRIADPLGSPPDLFTGVLMQPLLARHSLEPVLRIRHTQPTRFELAAMGAIVDAAVR